MATSSAMSSKWTMKRLPILSYVTVAAMIGLIVLGNPQKWHIKTIYGILLCFVLADVGLGGYFWSQSRLVRNVGVSRCWMSLSEGSE
jgi:hypothetical protein